MESYLIKPLIYYFLGSNGINHGIELHTDVIEYAQERLQVFIQTSPAFDEYEFCFPKFQQGNCLLLSSSERLYNRIYCGAACPEAYSDQIKKVCI